MSVYYTKCGITFNKPTNATVTGYKVDPYEQTQCMNCPFRKAIFETYPTRVFKHHECRAGSKPINFTKEYKGRLDDRNNLCIVGHNPKFTDAVIKMAKALDGVMYVDYSNEDTDDNRRNVIITIAKNKKGISAKNQIVDYFFGPNAPSFEDKLNHQLDDEVVEKKQRHPLEGVDMFEYLRNILSQNN